MKKRSLFIVLAAILVGCTIGGTMAYFTNQNTATNVITAGNIKAELQEWADLEMTVPYEDPDEYLVPGDNVTKVVTVKNTGAYDAWIRVQFVTTAEGENIPAEGELPMLLNVDTEAWTLSDGWYYYNAKLEPGTTAEPIFTTVDFDSAMDDNWQDAVFRINVAMQATQVANNGTSALDAAGWPTDTP